MNIEGVISEIQRVLLSLADVRPSTLTLLRKGGGNQHCQFQLLAPSSLAEEGWDGGKEGESPCP